MDRCSALKLLSPRSFLHGDRLTSVSGSIGKMQIFFYGWDYPSWPGSSGNSQSVDFSEMFNWKWEMPWQMLKFLHRNSQTLWLRSPLWELLSLCTFGNSPFKALALFETWYNHYIVTFIINNLPPPLFSVTVHFWQVAISETCFHCFPVLRRFFGDSVQQSGRCSCWSSASILPGWCVIPASIIQSLCMEYLPENSKMM